VADRSRKRRKAEQVSRAGAEADRSRWVPGSAAGRGGQKEHRADELIASWRAEGAD